MADSTVPHGMGFLGCNDGTYSCIRVITVTVNQETLTSVQLDYGIDGQKFQRAHMEVPMEPE